MAKPKRKPPAVPKKKAQALQRKKPYCFVSYSTREPHVILLLEALQHVLGEHYEVKVTPSALTSGASQLERIIELAHHCTFGIVSLDGLRANVSFEYGILRAFAKPIILLKEANAEVDVRGYIGDIPDLKISPVSLNLDVHFSDVKDVNFALWKRYSFLETCRIVWDEFRKKKNEIDPFIDIPEPK